MCGLAGLFRFDGVAPDVAVVKRATGALELRGPDGVGLFEGEGCALLHTRLAVIDLAGGEQPMVAEAREDEEAGVGEGVDEGMCVVVFNGEIYNHRALRRRLEGMGHVFVTDHADTEVLLHGYRQWGEKLPGYLEGMFAFGIWDAGKGELFLARDRIGKKPLYYSFEEGGVLFGSTVGAIAAMDETKARGLNAEALRRYLTFGYTGAESLMEGVVELGAGRWMKVGADGGTRVERYWQAPRLSKTDTTYGGVEAVQRVLGNAVEARLESDVPLGCFLSGGVDSSLIAALAQRQLGKAGGEPLRTFSVAMPDAKYDESPYARAVAKHLGTRHMELVAEADVEQDLIFLTKLSGEPLGDSSILPTYWLSRAAREHVTVALSGDGGDELFAGYERYRGMQLLGRYGGLLKCLPVGLVGGSVHQKSKFAKLKRLVEAARESGDAERYRSIVQLFGDEELGALLGGGGLGDGLEGWEKDHDGADAARRWDLENYLPFDLLRKVDRASMAASLEVRCPILDTGVVDLAAHLPHGVLAPGGRSKHLLKTLAKGLLPGAVIDRPKMGFAIPLDGWLATSLRGVLEKYLLDGGGLVERGFDREVMERMIVDHAEGRAVHTHRLYGLLALGVYFETLEGE